VGNANVAPDGMAVFDATLAAEATKGHVTVTASGGEALRVIVDGVDVGSTPWEGDLAPGIHQITGRSSTSMALPQDVNVTAGARATVDLVTSATAGHLQVRTSDGRGIIYIDGAVKGEGAYSGDVVPGPHTIVVTREGYERYEKPVTLAARETRAETVTLQPIVGGGGEAAAAERAFEGTYGGFGLMGLFGLGGQGSELETGCDALGAASCKTGSPVGGGAFGYLGWTWNPVGFELFLAGSADTAQQTATFDGMGKSGNLPAAAPPRDEKFTFARFGGMAAVRARASFQGRLVRGTIAGGVGVVYRQLVMKRATTETDVPRDENYVPDGLSYVSPGVSAEGAVQIRLSPTVAIAAGLQFWAENAGGGKQVPAPTSPRFLASPNATPQAVPLDTPAYHIATGPQVFLGPFLGMQFGP
jgi:hypothetical protein